MERRDTQVLVVGGGPAGNAAATTLAKAGIDCILLEKAKLPHEKICGGLYTQKTLRALEKIMGMSDATEYVDAIRVNTAHEIEFYNGMKHMTTIRNEFPMTVVSRALQDHKLFQYACKHGAEGHEEQAVQSIDFDNRTATTNNGLEIHYRFLLACDGAYSRVENLLAKHDTRFKPKGPNMYGAALTVKSEDLPGIDPDKLRIYFNIIQSSYAGLFSFGDTIRFGCACFKSDGINLRERVKQFARDLGVRNIEQYKLQGALIPYGNINRKPVWHDHVLFCGDAAGFVEPLSAEGIYYALRSGNEAAEAIIAHSAESDKAVAKAYMQSAKRIIKMLDSSKFVGWLFSKKFFMNIFYKRDHLKSGFMPYFYAHKIELGEDTPLWKMRLNYKREKKKKSF